MQCHFFGESKMNYVSLIGRELIIHFFYCFSNRSKIDFFSSYLLGFRRTIYNSLLDKPDMVSYHI